MPSPTRLSRLADGLMEACWLAALVLTPLFFDIYSSRIFEPDKVALLRTLALILAAAWAIKRIDQPVLTGRQASPGSRPSMRSSPASTGWNFTACAALRTTLRKTSRTTSATSTASIRSTLRAFLRLPLVAPALATIVILVLGVALSVAPRISLAGSYQRAQGAYTTLSYLIIFAAVYANLRRQSQVDRLVTTIVLTSLPIAVYGVLQRFALDPLPWGADTVERVTSTMGNAIFIAAYLIMACMLTVGRVVESIRNTQHAEEKARPAILTALYVLILLAQLTAIYFSGSRGPWLGLLAGLYFFSIMLAATLRRRKLVMGLLAAAALIGAFLITLNIPGGPLEPVRALPGIGRLGHAFETEEGTGKVRVLIWEGNVKLMSPHPPLRFPDGSADRLNAIRPLVGYGLESLYVAFNPFYPPELAYVEARNASPDRSHNETWDAVTFSGVLGLLVYLTLFASVFYYGLKWLGFIPSMRRKWIFVALYLGGGLAGAIGFWLIRGPEFFGVGLPSGVLVGLLTFLAFTALFPAKCGAKCRTRGEVPPTETPTASPRAGILIAAIVGALVAHFAEINFGIAIVSTRLHFWTLAGLMAVVGLGLTTEEDVPAAADEAARQGGKRKRRREVELHHTPVEAAGGWTGPAVRAGLLLGLIVLTLGFDFIANGSRLTQAIEIIFEAFTRLPQRGNAVSAESAILFLVIGTWALGALVLWLSGEGELRPVALGVVAGVSLGVAVPGWMVTAARLASVAAINPTNLDELIALNDRLIGVMGGFYALLFLLLAGLAFALAPGGAVRWWNPGGEHAPAGTKVMVGTLHLSLLIFAILLGLVSNLRIVQADITFKTAGSFEAGGPIQAVIALYQRALTLAPNEDYYQLFLGRAYLTATASAETSEERDQYLKEARAVLLRAQKLNPLNTDHTANLGRLYRRWAELTTGDAAMRAELAQTADRYYEDALSLSPNGSVLWNERATLNYQVLGQFDTAQIYFERSVDLDPKFAQTYDYLGAFFATQASAETDAAKKADLQKKAIAALEKSVELNTDHAGKRNTLTALAQVYVDSQNYQAAAEQYLRMIGLATENPWQIYRAVANLYQQAGQNEKAREYALLWLQKAPVDGALEAKAMLENLGP